MGSGLALFGRLLAGSADLAAFAGDGGVNTDDRPLVTFGAPWIVYGRRPAPYANLRLLLERFRPRAADVLAAGSGADELEFADRLDRYLLARRLFMEGEIELGLHHRATALDRYRASARASSEFRPAYDAMLRWTRDGSRLDSAAGGPSTGLRGGLP